MLLRQRVTLFTVISGVPESPVAFPARLPENEDAVIIPTLKSSVVDIAVVKPARSDILDILLPF